MSTLLYATHPEVEIDPDVPVPRWGLSAVGRARAHDLAAHPELVGLARIITSDEAKAVGAAEIVAAAHHLTVEVRPATHENDRSSTGYLPADVFERHADAFFARPDESVDGWERAVDAQSRIVGALADLLGTDEHDGDDGDILVVGHGAVGTLWLCHLAGAPIDRSWDQPHPGHLAAVDRRTGRLVRRWVAY